MLDVRGVAGGQSSLLGVRDGMPVAQQDQWRQDRPSEGGSGEDGAGPDSAAIARLEAALLRIASAAGRQQDQLREAELTAQTAQYELETLLAERQRPSEARDLVGRLDALIAAVRTALGEPIPPAPPVADADPVAADPARPGPG